MPRRALLRLLSALRRHFFVKAPSRESAQRQIERETLARAAAVARLTEELDRLESAMARQGKGEAR